MASVHPPMSLAAAVYRPHISFIIASRQYNRTLVGQISTGRSSELAQFGSLKGRLLSLALLVGAPLIYTVKTVVRVAFLAFTTLLFALNLSATVITAGLYKPSRDALMPMLQQIGSQLGMLGLDTLSFAICEETALGAIIHPGVLYGNIPRQ